LIAAIVVPQLASYLMEAAAAGGSTTLWTATTVMEGAEVVATGASAGITTGGSAIAAMAGGFAAGGISGGNLQSAITGAFTALASFGVGEAFNAHGGVSHLSDGMRAGHVASHALVGCASVTMAGGNCKAGAMAAGFSALAGPSISSVAGDNFETNLLGRMMVGGVASKLSGGEFANGALSAAFEYLYNNRGRTGRTLRSYFEQMAEFQLEVQAAILRSQIQSLGGTVPNFVSAAGGVSRSQVETLQTQLEAQVTRVDINARSQYRRDEVAQVKLTGGGRYEWTREQLEYIRTNGKLPEGYAIHHIRPIIQNPLLAGTQSNLQVLSRAEHVMAHKF
jgi:hypothetical protein